MNYNNFLARVEPINSATPVIYYTFFRHYIIIYIYINKCIQY